VRDQVNLGEARNPHVPGLGLHRNLVLEQGAGSSAAVHASLQPSLALSQAAVDLAGGWREVALHSALTGVSTQGIRAAAGRQAHRPGYPPLPIPPEAPTPPGHSSGSATVGVRVRPDGSGGPFSSRIAYFR
jgi:hypothetical protein